MINNVDKNIEDFIRENIDVNLSDYFLIRVFRSLSIDFIRELSKHMDIQQFLWSKYPWRVEEDTEEHMIRCFPHLEEFWKSMLTNEKYKDHWNKK